MKKHNFFVSLVLVAEDSYLSLENNLRKIGQMLNLIAEDYEIVIVDNASQDDTLTLLQKLTKIDGIPNLESFILTKKVDLDIATWARVENSLGDVVIAFDPLSDDLSIIPEMLEIFSNGKEIIFAKNRLKQNSFLYNFTYYFYNLIFKILSGINLSDESPSFRLISRRVVNYLLKFSDSAQQYRFLTANAGFTKKIIYYDLKIKNWKKKSIMENIEKGMSLLISTTKAPMRIVNFCSLFGAIANLIYSIYVIFIAFNKKDVAPGWVTLSLQQSGMFFLISIVLFVLGEYILRHVKLELWSTWSFFICR